ncbi:unannotated protein [freshwater metagenome]|uniref:Unannotated protein n=1 Tax=freshwater metagenome TaxID=449393 RepID=A0A6J7IFW6_9ZZZZ|nr:hypothetical protein [Actinomycetota bacterium]
MTDQPTDPFADGREPTEDELRAAYEAEIKLMRVEEVLAQTLVSLLNLGARKAGLAPGTEDERDLEQLHLAVEGARAMLALCEPALGPDGPPIRDALSQLQLAYVQLSGEAGGEGAPGPGTPPGGPDAPAPDAGGGGPAQSSGRLWVPGQ